MKNKKHVFVSTHKHWGLGLLAVCAVCLLVGGIGCPPPPGGSIEAVYGRFTPMVADESRIADVIYEVKIQGSPTGVFLDLESGGSLELRDNGIIPDTTAGDGIYTAAVAMSHILHGFTAADVNRNFIGFLDIYSGSDRVDRKNIIADIFTGDIPPVDIVIQSPTVQYGRHLVNIVSPGFFSTFSYTDITTIFYSFFHDNYDFINIIYELSYFENRFHAPIKNEIQGIGMDVTADIPAATAPYGSDGRLMGFTVFPLPTYFDGASPSYQHELGHQWVNFLTVPPLDVAVPHWPLSDLAPGLMGWGEGRNTQGLDFSFNLVHVGGGNYQLDPDYEPKVFSDLSLYLMGLMPASEVSGHFVFDNQAQTPAAGGMLLGPVTTVSVSDIITALGARVPAHGDAQKKFRVATIIVSKDGLLDDHAMRLYDYFSVRAEATEILPYSQGRIGGQTKPFYLSTGERGRLDTRIKHKILVDASRDGGVWWFPQFGVFNPDAAHQGLALAAHLRSICNKVEELPRPYTITSELLADCEIVVRAVGFGQYTEEEIAAYQDYVRGGGNLLLLADHGSPDALALSFGIRFEGATRGANLLNNYNPHPITDGAGSIFYNCGGALTAYPTDASILGSLSADSYNDLNNNGVRDEGEPWGPPVLGVMTYGEGRIVFCGDTNLWETVPLPFIINVFQWFSGF